MDPVSQSNTIDDRRHKVNDIKQGRDAVQHAELLVQRGHLLAVRLRVPAPLAILLLLLPPLADARRRSRQQDEPIRQPGDKGRRKRDKSAPSVGRVEEAAQATRGAEWAPARQREGEDDRKRCLQAKVPREGLGLEIRELKLGEVFELDYGGDASLGSEAC